MREVRGGTGGWAVYEERRGKEGGRGRRSEERIREGGVSEEEKAEMRRSMRVVEVVGRRAVWKRV